MLLRLKTEHPFLFLLLPFIIGISLNIWVLPAVPPILIYSFFGTFTLLFISLNAVYRRCKLDKGRQWLGGFLITCILLLAGYIAALQNNELNNSTFFANRKAERLLVQISNEPKLNGRYLRFAATVRQTIYHHTSEKASGNLLLIVPLSGTSNRLAYGNEVLIDASYEAVTPAFNPAEFNYKQYLAYQNIHYQAFVNPGKLRIIQQRSGNPLISYALHLRRMCVERLKTGLKDSSAAAVASTLMLGYKADLSNDLLQAYSRTGTLHVLSVSGAHVAIIYALLLTVLGGLRRYRYGQMWSAIITIILIWGYSLLTGFSPAVCRAALMITLYIVGKTLFRQVSSLNLLAASAFVLLIYKPLLLADVGFQLSYCAVFGLFIFQPVIFKMVEVKNKWLSKLWLVTSASIAAQLVTLPLSIYYFHQFPIYFLISNLLIIIPTEVIMLTGAAYLLVYPIHWAAAVLGWILNYVITGMNTSLMYIENLPYASVNGFWLRQSEILVLAILIVCIILLLHLRKAQSLLAALMCVLILSVAASLKNYSAINSHTLTFLNLKKHTGILFQSGKNSMLITDLSVADKNFSYTIQPYLDSNRIEQNSVVGLKQNAEQSFCKKEGNYIHFLHEAVLIADISFHYQPLLHPVKIKYLYITGSPKFTLNLLARSYIYNTVIAGANNSNQAIERYRQQALAQHKLFFSLKRNKAFIVASN